MLGILAMISRRGLLADDRVQTGVVLATNVCAMGVAYLYQVGGSRCLSNESFAALSVWLGKLGILSAPALLLQIRFMLKPSAWVRWRGLYYAEVGLSGLALLLHLAFPGKASQGLLLVETVVGGMLASIRVGVLMSRLLLVRQAIFGFAGTVSRLAFPLVFVRLGESVFYEANAVATWVLVLLCHMVPKEVSARLEPISSPRLGSWPQVLLLGLLQSAVPFAQIFAATSLCPAEVAGRFAKLSVLTRAPLLLGMALLNIGLVRAARSQKARHVEGVAIGQCLVAFVVFAALGPYALSIVSVDHQAGDRAVLAASTLDHAGLLALFATCQNHLVRNRLRSALTVAVAAVLPPLLLSWCTEVPLASLLFLHAGLCLVIVAANRFLEKESAVVA